MMFIKHLANQCLGEIHVDEIYRLKVGDARLGCQPILIFCKGLTAPLMPPSIEEESDRDEGDLPSQMWRKFRISVGWVKEALVSK